MAEYSYPSSLQILVAFFRSLFVDTFPPAPKFLTSFKPPERGANSFLHCSNFPMLGNHICSKFAKILQVGRARTIKDPPSPHLRDDIDSCILIKDFKNYYNINSIAAPRATLTPLSCWPSQMPEVYPGRRGGGGEVVEVSIWSTHLEKAWCPLHLVDEAIKIASELWNCGQSLFYCCHAVFQGVSRWLNSDVRLCANVSVGQWTRHNCIAHVALE